LTKDQSFPVILIRLIFYAAPYRKISRGKINNENKFPAAKNLLATAVEASLYFVTFEAQNKSVHTPQTSLSAIKHLSPHVSNIIHIRYVCV
jgi:hypothetical protein